MFFVPRHPRISPLLSLFIEGTSCLKESFVSFQKCFNSAIKSESIMSESGENSKEVAEALPQPGQQGSSSLKQETQSVSATQDDSNSPNENTEQTNAVAESVSTAAGANASPNDKQSEPETAKKNTEAAEGAKEEKSAENEAADANDAQSDNDEEQPVEERKDTETATDATADSEGEKQASSGPIVSSSKKNRPPYKYDPNKITLRFLFANKDGLTVTVECNPTDTVGEVKGALISVWPNGEYNARYCSPKKHLFPSHSQRCSRVQTCLCVKVVRICA